MASYDDGTPAAGALVTATNHKTGVRDAVVIADAAGNFAAALAPGSYSMTVTTEHGFAWRESQIAPSPAAGITLTRTCHPVTGQAVAGQAVAGQAVAGQPGTRVELARRSKPSGYTFVAAARADGAFAMCVPEGEYSAALAGATLSFDAPVSVPTAASLRIAGFATAEVERAPQILRKLAADPGGLVAEIARSDVRLIGLGEATHGTAEFVPTRGELTIELMRHAGVGAVLFELDAIAAQKLDDYIQGGDIDLAKAVPALGFWVTDTYEFVHFLEQLRQYNATTADRVHLWGIDVQNTALPVQVLIGNAAALGLSSDDKAALERVSKNRGKPVNELSAAQRAGLTQVLDRVGAPRSASVADVRIALAARSLTVQLGYWDGDMAGHYGERRDAGMASLAHFVVAQTGVKRACVWAHDAHIARHSAGERLNLGQRLAEASDRYYAVGFYLYQGSARAWDAPAEIGVISHPIPPAAPFTVEAAVMAATGAPEVAWISVKRLATALGSWLDTPRFVREIGALYAGEQDSMGVRHIPTAFDALVVIKTGHDSSPTPTGVRRVEK